MVAQQQCVASRSRALRRLCAHPRRDFRSWLYAGYRRQHRRGNDTCGANDQDLKSLLQMAPLFIVNGRVLRAKTTSLALKYCRETPCTSFIAYNADFTGCDVFSLPVKTLGLHNCKNVPFFLPPPTLKRFCAYETRISFMSLLLTFGHADLFQYCRGDIQISIRI